MSATIRSERLLARADHGIAPPGGFRVRAAKALVTRLLGRMRHDHLKVLDRTSAPPSILVLGSGESGDHRRSISATVEIHDGRAWLAVASEGSIGLGRGFIEGWWSSDDPVNVVRVIIRNIEPIDEIRNRISSTTGWLTDRLRTLLPRAGRARNRDDISSHYDLGNSFFEIFLDETMTYSAAVFESDGATLAEASLSKYDRLIDKLGVNSGHSLLEIGTGWGGFAVRAAETTGASITTTTISSEQLAEATKRVADARLQDRVTLLDTDWRDLSGHYDRVVSIEMIEAVDWRDYDRYFSTIERCLAPDGLVAIQAICVPDRRYARTKNTEDFIRRFVFPGGFLPSLGSIVGSVSRATHMQVVDVEDLSAHYAETLRRWRETFDDSIDEIRALGLDDEFCRLWRFYLAYCEAAFTERHCTVNQIVIAGRRWRPAGLELRPR
jgi:cyclopropane-fatty-acyl-phospholipid synthase